MKETNHSLKENWRLKSGSIILTALLTLTYFSINANVIISNESISLKTVRGDLLLAYVDKCPGEISGECTRSLFMLSDYEHRSKDFKKGVYQFHNDEIYIIFDPLHIKIFLSNLEFIEEKGLTKLLKFFSTEKNLWKYNLEDFETIKKGKVKLKKLSNLENKALLIKTSSSFLNEIYNNRIIVKSNNNEIIVAILFENKSLSEVEILINSIK